MINYIGHHRALPAPLEAISLAQFLLRIPLLAVSRADVLTGSDMMMVSDNWSEKGGDER